MKTLILSAALSAFVLPACAAGKAHISPPTWTMLRQACWQDNEGNRQCAIALFGSFPTREACMARNRGQLETQGLMPDGRKIGQRCEMHLEGDF